MSVLEEVLIEEHERSLRISDALEEELSKLPRGSIRKRIINGRPYYYLQYREGEHVRSVYVARNELEELQAKLVRRKEVLNSLKEQEQSRKQIKRALGNKLK